jgi:hypothetical protein
VRHVLLCCALLAGSSSAQDFRKATWGMSQAQVVATESNAPSEVREGSGERIVQYDSVRVGERNARLLYIFAKDKLVRTKYLFDAQHEDLNDFIGDYKAIEPLLIETHGKPASERAIWEDDAFQIERKTYLDQDRATPSSILTSDALVGLSVAAGHLKLYTRWSNDRTKILHGLTGENDRIAHQIEYLSAELEKFEDEVRSSSAR